MIALIVFISNQYIPTMNYIKPFHSIFQYVKDCKACGKRVFYNIGKLKQCSIKKTTG